MINIGLDGIMTIGAGVGFIVGYLSGNPLLGLFAGSLAGVALNLIYAFSTISLRSGQTINGMALNILAPALSTFLSRHRFPKPFAGLNKPSGSEADADRR